MLVIEFGRKMFVFIYFSELFVILVQSIVCLFGYFFFFFVGNKFYVVRMFFFLSQFVFLVGGRREKLVVVFIVYQMFYLFIIFFYGERVDFVVGGVISFYSQLVVLYWFQFVVDWYLCVCGQVDVVFIDLMYILVYLGIRGFEVELWIDQEMIGKMGFQGSVCFFVNGVQFEVNFSV